MATEDEREALERPPFMSYDPALEAERRAGRRGLSDLIEDTQLANRWGRQDFAEALRTIGRGTRQDRRDIRRGTRRGRQQLGWQAQDARQSADRSMEDLGFQRADAIRGQQRTEEDFAERMADIGRQFGQLQGTQNQSINMAGGIDSGAVEAAGERRAENQELAERDPRQDFERAQEDFATQLGRFDTSEERTESDLAQSLGRIGVSQNQMQTDARRNLGQLGRDTRRDRRLTRQSVGRDFKQRQDKVMRGIREQKISDVDLTQQQIYNARGNHPGAFSKYGNRRRRTY